MCIDRPRPQLGGQADVDAPCCLTRAGPGAHVVRNQKKNTSGGARSERCLRLWVEGCRKKTRKATCLTGTARPDGQQWGPSPGIHVVV